MQNKKTQFEELLVASSILFIYAALPADSHSRVVRESLFRPFCLMD